MGRLGETRGRGMKFIHLTDTHVIGDGGMLYGLDPAARLRQAVTSINSEHGDAECVVLTGDMTHWGDASAYDTFRAEIARLSMPVHLMVGNHDDTDAFRAAFPHAARDGNGFVQTSFQTPHGRFILLDTRAPGTSAGHYCAARQSWLRKELEGTDDPVLLFMHHPPMAVGIARMDAIRLQDEAAFHDLIAPFKHRIRHIFFGHVHRAIFGSWHGLSFSCMRGLNHQVALDLSGDPGRIHGNAEPPAYGVALVDDTSVVVHLHDFSDDSAAFRL